MRNFFFFSSFHLVWTFISPTNFAGQSEQIRKDRQIGLRCCEGSHKLEMFDKLGWNSVHSIVLTRAI